MDQKMREIEEEYGVKEGRDVTNIKILKETVAKLGAEGEVLKEENLELRERVKRLEKSTKVIAQNYQKREIFQTSRE